MRSAKALFPKKGAFTGQFIFEHIFWGGHCLTHNPSLPGWMTLGRLQGLCVRVRVRVCVCERERERESERNGDTNCPVPAWGAALKQEWLPPPRERARTCTCRAALLGNAQAWDGGARRSGAFGARSLPGRPRHEEPGLGAGLRG